MKLPPGQRARDDFPRFGLPPYAKRFPQDLATRRLTVALEGEIVATVDLDDPSFEAVTLERDLHCVTTWTHRGNRWTGIRFRAFFDHALPAGHDLSGPGAGAVIVGQDGYRTSLPLEDLLHDDVLLATSLNGSPLDVRHGAPIRLVAPAHYGYKNLKHVRRIEFFSRLPTIKRGLKAFLDHPRARVMAEERGRWIPGLLLRLLYRPMIARTAKLFEGALRDVEGGVTRGTPDRD